MAIDTEVNVGDDSFHFISTLVFRAGMADSSSRLYAAAESYGSTSAIIMQFIVEPTI